MGEIINFPLPERHASLPEFETALGHLVIIRRITADQAYSQMNGTLPELPPEAA